jgi:mono/diheme cytochrome c family protein
MVRTLVSCVGRPEYGGEPLHLSREAIRMASALRLLLMIGALSLSAARVHAQASDTARGPEPDSTMLTATMIDAGRKVFHGKGTCSGCHGDKLQGGPVAPPLTGASWRHINGTYSAIIDRVDNGLPGTLMVPHPGGIEESQVFLVASYVYAVSHGLTKP